MTAVVNDLFETISFANLLYSVPSSAETWIYYEVPQWADKATIKERLDKTELDFVKFRTVGMPLSWKIANALLILVPKCALWVALVLAGFHYLMETAGIVDVIVNAMALAFVLEVDELVFERLGDTTTKHIMENLEDFPLFNTEEDEDAEEDTILADFRRKELGRGRLRGWMNIVPVRLLVVVALHTASVQFYYYRNCITRPDGSLVSKEMHLPKDDCNSLSGLGDLMFGADLAEVEKPFWNMPE